MLGNSDDDGGVGRVRLLDERYADQKARIQQSVAKRIKIHIAPVVASAAVEAEPTASATTAAAGAVATEQRKKG